MYDLSTETMGFIAGKSYYHKYLFLFLCFPESTRFWCPVLSTRFISWAIDECGFGTVGIEPSLSQVVPKGEEITMI
jgi:hypothetical protein